MKILVKKIHPEAKIPKFALAGDAGLDLYSIEDLTIKSGGRVVCRTGIAIKIPAGYVALIWDKSGISHKFGIKILGGVLDSNYTGEYLIGLTNLSNEDYKIKKGQKIAQVLFQKIITPQIKEVKELPQTNRGADCHGSTGMD